MCWPSSIVVGGAAVSSKKCDARRKRLQLAACASLNVQIDNKYVLAQLFMPLTLCSCCAQFTTSHRFISRKCVCLRPRLPFMRAN